MKTVPLFMDQSRPDHQEQVMNTRRQAGRGPGKRLRPTGRIVLIRDHRVLAGPRPVAQIPAKHRKVSV